MTLGTGEPRGFLQDSEVKNPLRSAGDVHSIPGGRKMSWRRKWHPTPKFCLENPDTGGGALAGYSLLGHKESDNDGALVPTDQCGKKSASAVQETQETGYCLLVGKIP